MTRGLYEMNLLTKLIVLLLQLQFNLDVTVVAEAILMRISDEQVPSSDRVPPGDLKLL